MNEDLKDLMFIVGEIAVHESRYDTIPWMLINQRDVLRKRIEKKLKQDD